MSVTTKTKATSRAGWAVWVIPALAVFVFAVTTVRLWPTTAPPRKATLRWVLGTEHDGDVTAMVFSPNGGSIATGGHDGTLLIRDARDGAIDKRSAPAPDKLRPTTPLGFSGEKTLVFANKKRISDQFILDYAWDVTELNVADGTPRKCYSGSFREELLHLFADGRTLATFADDSEKSDKLKSFDISTGEVVVHDLPPDHGLGSFNKQAFSADGKMFASMVHKSPVIAVRKTATGEAIRTFPGCDPANIKNEPLKLWLSPDGGVLVVKRLSRTDAYEMSTGSACHLAATDGFAGAVGFSADGRRMAIATLRFCMGFWERLRALGRPASAAEYLHITIVDLGSGRVVTTIRSNQRVPKTLALSADGRTLALIAAPEGEEPQKVFVWDLPE